LTVAGGNVASTAGRIYMSVDGNNSDMQARNVGISGTLGYGMGMHGTLQIRNIQRRGDAYPVFEFKNNWYRHFNWGPSTLRPSVMQHTESSGVYRRNSAMTHINFVTGTTNVEWKRGIVEARILY
jgi:hypothetical protein